MEKQEFSKKGNGTAIGGLVFVGCMFIGAGIGMYFNKVKVGGAIGMGVGFIGMAITRLNSTS